MRLAYAQTGRPYSKSIIRNFNTLPFQVDGMAVHLLDFVGNPSKNQEKIWECWKYRVHLRNMK
jgi:hypothetical protein